MRVNSVIVVVFVIATVLFLIGCSKQSMPYKTLSDVRLSTPTGAVVGVQKGITKTVEQVVDSSKKGPTCKDSKYGNFSTAFGKVSGTLADGSTYEISDTCFGDILFEYDCDANNANVVISKVKCPRGCQNGFCV